VQLKARREGLNHDEVPKAKGVQVRGNEGEHVQDLSEEMGRGVALAVLATVKAVEGEGAKLHEQRRRTPLRRGLPDGTVPQQQVGHLLDVRAYQSHILQVGEDERREAKVVAGDARRVEVLRGEGAEGVGQRQVGVSADELVREEQVVQLADAAGEVVVAVAELEEVVELGGVDGRPVGDEVKSGGPERLACPGEVDEGVPAGEGVVVMGCPVQWVQRWKQTLVRISLGRLRMCGLGGGLGGGWGGGLVLTRASMVKMPAKSET
jgi:hypothetical protein